MWVTTHRRVYLCIQTFGTHFCLMFAPCFSVLLLFVGSGGETNV